MNGYPERRDALLAGMRAAPGHRLGLAKETSNLFRDRSRGRKRLLDVRALNHVLEVNEAQGWVDAEGMTSYDELACRTLERRLMPAVVPQLKTITLGGAAAGVGIEASSFRYGLVHETLLGMDILTAGGQVLECSPDNEHSDLFHGFPNSYGTLGYALRLRARTIPAKPCVELTHRCFDRFDAFVRALQSACAGEADFIDSVAFGPGEFWLNVCRFVDEAPFTSDYTFEHIYYRSIREKATDYLTAHDFLWRWDTDWFWCSRNLGAQVPWIRRLYGRKRLGSRTYQKIMRWNSRWGATRALDRVRGQHAESVIQDVDVPVEHAAEFLDFFQRDIGITPVWICPVIPTPAAGRFVLYPMRPGKLYLNFGFWDVVRRAESKTAGYYNRLIEAELKRLGGIKSLYSDSYYPRDEFWSIYSGDAYRALKARYDPSGVFPDLYEKCVLRH